MADKGESEEEKGGWDGKYGAKPKSGVAMKVWEADCAEGDRHAVAQASGVDQHPGVAASSALDMQLVEAREEAARRWRMWGGRTEGIMVSFVSSFGQIVVKLLYFLNVRYTFS